MARLPDTHGGRGQAGESTARKREGPTIKEELKGAADVAEEVTNSKPLEYAARAGFAVSGILHFLIGLVAIRLAMGGRGQADVSGAVAELARQPGGPLLLWSAFVACVALALWQTSDAIFDFSHLPTKKKVGKKLKAALQAVVYAAFAISLISVALGTHADNRRSTSDLTVQLMKAPGGILLLIVIGAAVAITGVVYAIRGFRKSFLKYIRLPSNQQARTGVTVAGIAGYAAKGVALLLTGLLIVIATVKANPAESTGLDGGLKALRDQPLGVYMLAAVGAGLICYGIFLAVRARLGRM